MTFGRRVVGDEAFEREREKVAAGRDYFGSRVTGHAPEPAAPAPTVAENPPLEKRAYSVREVEQLLVDNAALVDELLAAEFERADGTRKGALRALLEAELHRAVPAREDVVAQITTALGG